MSRRIARGRAGAASAPVSTVLDVVVPGLGEENDPVSLYLSRVRATPAPTVTFGGVPATVTAVVGTIPGRIDVTVPAGSGTVDVVVTDYHGVSTKVGAFEYTGSPPPEDSMGWTATPTITEWFDYANLTALNANTARYPANEITNGSQQYLDATTAPAASPTGKSLEIRYKDETANPNRCVGGGSVSRKLRFDTEVGGSNLRELWVEFWVKFTADFVTNAPSEWSCSSGASGDLKLFFIAFSGQGRYEIRFLDQGSLWFFRYPRNPEDKLEVTVSGALDWRDDTWRRVRVHAKHSETISSADGAFQVYFEIDGEWVTMWDKTGINTTDDSGNNPVAKMIWLSIPANMNKGPDREQSLWWGGFKIWYTDPTA
jgi:hypothetical protein